MALPTLHGVGRLTADPELRFTHNGTAVCTIPLAFNSRRKNDQGEWEDANTFYIRGTLFGDSAENASESYSRGTEILVAGRMKTDQWQDKNTGDKRTAPALLIDAIGPSTRSGTATVATNGSHTTTPATTPPSGGDDSEPPF